MKLYAVFNPDGKRVSLASDTKWGAWWNYGLRCDSEIRKGRRAGYTCEPVEIVRKGERDGKAT